MKNEETQWISTKDRLPENEGMVIAYSDVNGVFATLYWEGSHYWERHITHWMPLPNPPEGMVKNETV